MDILVTSLWLAAFAAIITISVGVAVWLAQARSAFRRAFLELSVFIGLWILSNVVFAVVEGYQQFAAALLSYFFAMGVAVHLYLFARRAAERPVKIWPTIVLGYIVGVLAAVPNVVATGVQGGQVITNLWTLLVYGVVLAGFLLAAAIVLVKARHAARYIERKQLNVVLWGMGLAAAAGLFCNLILPIFDEYRFVQLGTASASLFVGAVALAVVKHGLLDVRQTILRSVTYGLVVVTMALLYVALAYGLTAPLRIKSATIDPVVVNVLVVLLLVFLFQPLRRFFDRVTNSFFYRGGYSHDLFSRKLNEIITTETDLNELLAAVSDLVIKTFMSSGATFVLQRDDAEPLVVSRQSDTGLPSAEVEQLIGWWSKRKDPNQPLVVRSDLSLEDVRDETIELINDLQAEVLFPLNYNRQPKGIVIMSQRRGGHYSMNDIYVLNEAMDELAIAIQNAISIQEIKNLNDNLQLKVEEATGELLKSNAELVKLDEAKDEFISMASHQLRTPLTSIKGYLDMMLDGDSGELTDLQKQFLSEAFTSSERMVGLINDFLNVSRLQTGKFVIEKQPIDLRAVVEQEVGSLQVSATGRDLAFDLQIEDAPKLMLDESKIRQVIINMIDNALFYSPAGSTVVVRLAVGDDEVRFEVEDSGIGVPKEEQEKLFTKFFRATNARKQRPDGTGIGLFLAKRVVDDHGGEIIFSSREGKGSTFGFRLPVSKLAAANKSDDLDNNHDDN